LRHAVGTARPADFFQSERKAPRVAQLECPHRPFRLDQVESWPECLEILIEGELDLPATEVLRDALERALDSDRLYVIVDLDRCEWIDIDAVKLLVVAHAHHSSRGEEFLIFGATDLVRRRIEGIHAFDDRVLLTPARDQ
jgi:anti-anti-sigma regulatory factor